MAGKHRRRDVTLAGGRPLAETLFHRQGLRSRRPRHDLGSNIAGLEERKLEYILGARERSDAVVRKIVLENDDPFVTLLVERKAGETQLFVKQVKAEGVRYVVCRNEAEAENDARTVKRSSPRSMRN